MRLRLASGPLRDRYRRAASVRSCSEIARDRGARGVISNAPPWLVAWAANPEGAAAKTTTDPADEHQRPKRQTPAPLGYRSAGFLTSARSRVRFMVAPYTFEGNHTAKPEFGELAKQ